MDESSTGGAASSKFGEFTTFPSKFLESNFNQEGGLYFFKEEDSFWKNAFLRELGLRLILSPFLTE